MINSVRLLYTGQHGHAKIEGDGFSASVLIGSRPVDSLRNMADDNLARAERLVRQAERLRAAANWLELDQKAKY